MDNSGMLFKLLLLVTLGIGLVPPVTANATPQADGRVVVLGFDGADARTVRELMETRPDDYPNFKRLAESGVFAPLEVVAPPESPVSWAAINTGQNPAKTGVPGFVKRALSPGRPPAPTLGHISTGEIDVAELENLPIPNWSPSAMAGAAGGAAFLVVLLLLLLLLRGRFVIALVAALVVGAAAAYAGHTVRGYLPEKAPHTSNYNKARNFWDFAGDAGVPGVVIDPAQAFDMPAPEGVRVLSGLGVPDARGAIGEWFIYTTNPEEFSRPPKGRGRLTAGTVFRVDERDGEIRTKIYGPRNFWLEEKLEREIEQIGQELKRPELPLKASVKLSERNSELKDQLNQAKLERTSVDFVVRREGETARVTVGSQEQVLREGEWSEFFELAFELNPLIKASAITRVRLIELDDPHFQIFVNVLDIDPRDPPFWQPISEPFGFAAELAHECGLYETYGWPTATMPFKDSLVPPEVLLEDVEFTVAWRERLTYSQLEKDDWRFLMSVFSTTDRVQHMMYRFYDGGHPMHDAEEAAHRVTFFGEEMALSETIPMIYRQMDRVVGKVMDEHLRPDDTLLVVSDHGFQSFRHQVHVNNLLAELGYLALKPLAKKADGEGLRFVDWDNTRAYSMGMGFVYLNLKGREHKGIVEQAQADELLRSIKADLLGARDPVTGELVCRDAYITKEVHRGPYLDMEADMLLGFAPTFRVSWSSTFGGLEVSEDAAGGWVAAPITSPNESLWSGGHVSVALPDVAGVFFSNRRVNTEGGVKALQLGPTVLDLLDVPVPAEMDLGPLEF